MFLDFSIYYYSLKIKQCKYCHIFLNNLKHGYMNKQPTSWSNKRFKFYIYIVFKTLFNFKIIRKKILLWKIGNIIFPIFYMICKCPKDVCKYLVFDTGVFVFCFFVISIVRNEYPKDVLCLLLFFRSLCFCYCLRFDQINFFIMK